MRASFRATNPSQYALAVILLTIFKTNKKLIKSQTNE